MALHNNSFASLPILDIMEMILSIVHDSTIMWNDKFAMGLDIFTRDVDLTCAAYNRCYGEIHQRIHGEGKYMPYPLLGTIHAANQMMPPEILHVLLCKHRLVVERARMS